MLIPISYYIHNSPDSYFIDLATQIRENIEGSVICSIDEIEDHIDDHDVIFCIRGSGFERRDLMENKKVIVNFDDIHYAENKFRSRINLFEFADVLLLPYHKQFMKMEEYEKYHTKSYWLPYHAPINSLVDFDIKWDQKINKCLLTGRSSESYNFRNHIINGPCENIDILRHPGYHGKYSHDIIKENYFKEVSKYKGGIITSANKNQYGFDLSYTLMKYFEIPACGVVPFMEETVDTYDLGFRDGENCIFINEDNYLSKIENHLNDEGISIRSRDFILKNHTFKNRLDLIKKHI